MLLSQYKVCIVACRSHGTFKKGLGFMNYVSRWCRIGSLAALIASTTTLSPLLVPRAALADPTALHVSNGGQGNILAFDGDDATPASLHGVACYGLETANWSNGDGSFYRARFLESIKAALGLTYSRVSEAYNPATGQNGPQYNETYSSPWAAKIIRLPLSEDRWLGQAPNDFTGPNKGINPSTGLSYAQEYRNFVYTVVGTITAAGGYVILDLHWSNAGGTGTPDQHNMPDADSVKFWQSVASDGNFQNHSNVLFGLYNEPHVSEDNSDWRNNAAAWKVWRDGGQEDEGGGRVYQAVGLQTLVHTIRDTGAANVIVAGGLDYAFKLTGLVDGGDGQSYALNDFNSAHNYNGRGIIYDVHAYAKKDYRLFTDTNGIRSDQGQNSPGMQYYDPSKNNVINFDTLSAPWNSAYDRFARRNAEVLGIGLDAGDPLFATILNKYPLFFGEFGPGGDGTSQSGLWLRGKAAQDWEVDNYAWMNAYGINGTAWSFAVRGVEGAFLKTEDTFLPTDGGAYSVPYDTVVDRNDINSNTFPASDAFGTLTISWLNNSIDYSGRDYSFENTGSVKTQGAVGHSSTPPPTGSTQGWKSSTGVTSVAATTTKHFLGKYSLAVNITATANTKGVAYVSNPALKKGSMIMFRVWIPTNANIDWIQPYVKQGASTNYAYTGHWVPMVRLKKNAWNAITVQVPSNAVTPMYELGLEIHSVSAWQGTCYLDNIAW